MLERFLTYIRQENLIKNNTTTLLAVSGGMDSMVLADLFIKSSLPFGIAHINHHLRGIESDDDAEFVKNYSRANNIPYFEHDLNPVILKQGNLQKNARDLRYVWLKNVANQFDYTYIATAHHSDDAIETFMINLIRGSGLSGLTGISQERENIIRPLLFAARNDINEYCRKCNICYREDSSNISDKYLRNRLRNSILPSFYDIDNRAREGINISLDHLRQSRILLDFLVSKYSQDYIKTSFDEQIIDLSFLPEGEIGEQWLFQIIKHSDFNLTQAKNILEHKYSTGNYFKTQSHEAILNRGHLIIRNRQESELKKVRIPVSPPFSFKWFKYEICINRILFSPQLDISDSSEILYLNADNLKGNLELRNYEKGDYIKPSGMGGKSQKIKEFLINNKVSVFEKEKVLVLTHEAEIIAIPGYRKSELVNVKEDTKEVLQVKMSVYSE